MKKIAILLTLIISHFSVEAQVKIPETSPKAIVKQIVGLTDVEIVYSRPGQKAEPFMVI